LDDFKNRCGLGKHPLLKIIHAGLRDETVATTQSSIASTKYTQSSTSSYSTTTVKEDEEYDEYYEDEDNIETNNNETPKPIDNVTKPPSHDVEITTPKVDEIDESEEEEEEEEDFDDENEIDTSAEDFRVVCYFTNWAWYRPGIGKFLPENIDPELCTHIVYGFAVLNRDTLTIQPHDSWADIDNNFYKRVCDLKKKGLKVSVAIGGWNDSAGDKYSRLVRSAESRRKFIKHVTEFIEKYDFDGLDLDWEYPVCWQVDCTKGKADEKEHFSSLVEELSAVFKPKGLLLSSAVSPAKKVIDAGYDVPKLAKHFDWIAVMTYDYHGQWDKKTGHVAPMYTHKDAWEPTFNANFTINYWIEKGAPRKSLVMGIPMYGQSFSLADASNNGLNAMTYGGGEAGEETRARGFLAYYEICQNIKNKNWEVVRDNGGKMGPYARKKDQWVSFDDVSMVRYKSQFIKAMGLGGAMIW
jgi:chitinase